MSMSNATENDVLEMVCKGIDPSWRSGATGYWALFTADPGESGSQGGRHRGGSVRLTGTHDTTQRP